MRDVMNVISDDSVWGDYLLTRFAWADENHMEEDRSKGSESFCDIFFFAVFFSFLPRRAVAEPDTDERQSSR